jgi:hypothetical protein
LKLNHIQRGTHLLRSNDYLNVRKFVPGPDAPTQPVAPLPLTPIYATCCAFVGDLGFSHPELTHSATALCDSYEARNKFSKGWQRRSRSHGLPRLQHHHKGPDKSVDEISNVQNFVYTGTGGRMI